MFYVGLDIHVKHITICVLDACGNVYRRGQVKTIALMMDVLESLPEPWRVCYEASTGYGVYYQTLARAADHVAVAQAGSWQPGGSDRDVAVETTGSPAFPGNPMCSCPVLRPRRDRCIWPSRGAGAAPAASTAKAPTTRLSRLHHTASTLAVYASQDGLLHHHARFASGCRPSSTRRDWLPAGFLRKVSNSRHVRLPPFPNLVAQGLAALCCSSRLSPFPRSTPRTIQLVEVAGAMGSSDFLLAFLSTVPPGAFSDGSVSRRHRRDRNENQQDLPVLALGVFFFRTCSGSLTPPRPIASGFIDALDVAFRSQHRVRARNSERSEIHGRPARTSCQCETRDVATAGA
jgi:hypothetical protein